MKSIINHSFAVHGDSLMMTWLSLMRWMILQFIHLCHAGCAWQLWSTGRYRTPLVLLKVLVPVSCNYSKGVWDFSNGPELVRKWSVWGGDSWKNTHNSWDYSHHPAISLGQTLYPWSSSFTISKWQHVHQRFRPISSFWLQLTVSPLSVLVWDPWVVLMAVSQYICSRILLNPNDLLGPQQTSCKNIL